MTITTKLDPHSKLYDLLITWLRGKYKSLIYTPAVLMTTKPARGVTCGG